MSIKIGGFVFRLFGLLVLLAVSVNTLGISPAYAAGILYVTPGGAGDCLSWATACTLQTALVDAVSGGEIWVAAGIYKPTTGADRAATFQLIDGVAVYGGFAGMETSRDQRTPATNLTILSGDIDNNDSQTPIISDLTIVTGNTTNSYHVITGANNATLDGFTITAGNANGGGSCPDTNCGGGMLNNSSSPTLTNVTFNGNSAATFSGGMENLNSNPILTNVTFSGNSAIYGGGMGNLLSAPVLTNVTFSGNSAADGGGMYDQSSNPTLANVTFTSNSATDGGGIYNYSNSNPTLTNVTFNSNSATNNGGGMLNTTNSNPGLTDVTFSGNSATNNGGGMHNYSGSSPTLTDVSFSGNSAAYGGGMENYTSCNPTLIRVTFSGNTATSGGAMYNYSSNPGLTDVTFSGNSASDRGGGIYNDTNSSPTLTKVTFSTCSATNYGGGMFNYSSSNPTLTNVTFSGNTATNGGGGLFNYSSSPILTNVTISTNSGTSYGGGMLNYSASHPHVYNAILWGNTASTAGAQVHNNDTSTSGINSSIVQDGCPVGNGDPCVSVIATDPKLGSLGNYGGFTQTVPLLPGSSAIEAIGIGTYGCGTTLLTDQRGVARPQKAICDAGAYEYNSTGFLYVKSVTNGTGNCQSWATACSLQTALTGASSGEIWVANGVYKPTMGTDRASTFQLKSGVAIYGGFAGTETARSQRDFVANVTILSGDLSGNDNNNIKWDEPTRADNSYHVVTGATGATLDGFTITAGNARGGAPNIGGGIYNDSKSPKLTNIIFSANTAGSGGGMGNQNTSNPILVNVIFSGNSAYYNGGGVYNVGGINQQSNPTLTNVAFIDNLTTNGGGGGMANGCSPTLTNVTFSDNLAKTHGGGMASGTGRPTLTNVTFSGNSAAYGGGMENTDSGTPIIRNTVFWGNTATIDGAQLYNFITMGTPGSSNVNDSVIQGGCAAGDICTNIITTDPKLGILGDYGGFTQTIPLLPGSSAINTGNNGTCYPTDQRGITRPQGVQCDIGAYEAVLDTTAPTVNSITRVNPSPTTLASVQFTVTFSKPVADVDVADFKLANTLLTGASITNVSGSGDTYTVTVNTGIGNGTIRLDVTSTATIQDLGYAFVGPYADGETYTVSKGTAPTVPVLVSPTNNALVTDYQPTLDWNDSSQVMALTTLGWHYEINVTSPAGYNLTDNTTNNADPLIGLGESEYSFSTPLPANTTFAWKVRAYNDENQYSAWSATRTFRTKPPSAPLTPPTLISPNGTLDNKRPTFEWSDVPGTTTYTLQILDGVKVVNTGTIKAPLHTYTPAADLLPNKTYSWQVKANGTISSIYSAPFTFTTSAANPPTIPVLTLPASNALVDSSVVQTLKWNLVFATTTNPTAANYEVEYAANSAFTGSTTVPVVITQQPIAIGALSPNLTYYWHVRSVSAAGNHSAWSLVRTFRTMLSTPVLNLPAHGAVLDNKRPTFSWDEVPGATTYTLQILNGTKVVNTGTIKAPTYTYTPSVDLLPDTTYQWKVKANGANAGNYSVPFSFTTSANPPAIPVLFAPANDALLMDNAAQKLDWNASLGAPTSGSYEVEYAMNSSFSGASDKLEVVNNSVGTELSIITLPGRTYYWRVRAWSEADANGNHSAWSVVRTIKIKFAAPALDSATPVGGNLTFAWHSDNGLWTNYTLTIINSTTNKVVKSFTVPAPTTTYTIPAALLPAGTYRWQVKINGLYTPISSAVSSDTFTK